MRIFNASLVILVAAILFMLPITEAIYDFRTDLREDTFSTSTAVSVSTANETLLQALYNEDIGSIGIVSDAAADTPLPNSYNSTSQVLNITGLTANTTRVLVISYDIDALGASDAINTFLGWIPYIWLIVIAVFPMAAIFAIFTGRA